MKTLLRKLAFLLAASAALQTPIASRLAKADDDQKEAARAQLAEQAHKLRSNKKYLEAAEVGRKLLELERTILAADDDDLPFTMKWLAEVYEAAERWDDAEKYRAEFYAWYRKFVGGEHWQTTDARFLLEDVRLARKFTAADREQLTEADRNTEAGKVARLEGRWDDARHSLDQAIDVRRRLLGEKHRLTLVSLFYRALMLSDQGDYEASHKLLATLTADAAEVFGKNHPYYLTALTAYGSVSLLLGDAAAAERLQREALEGRRKALGERDKNFAMSLNCVAQALQAQGRFDEAGKYFEQAVVVVRESGDRAMYFLFANNLATHLLSRGRYAEAEPLYRECLPIAAKEFGEKHYQYAKSLGNLAELLKETGDIAQAEQFSSRGEAVARAAYGERHPEYAVMLANLAEIRGLAGDSQAARRGMKQALDILEETVGPRHPSAIIVANNLAATYQELELYRLAERTHRRVLELAGEVHGPRHRLSLTSLSNLAGVCSALGKREEARELYGRCLELRQAALGESHPDCQTSLHNLACEYAEVGRDAEAAPLFRECIRRTRELVEQTAIVQSERQQLAMAQTLRFRLDAFVSLAARDAKFGRQVFEEVLAWKGATLVRQRGMRLVADDPAVGQLFRQLQETARQLVATSRTPPEAEAAQIAWREEVAKLTAEKERLERELSRRSAEFRRAVRNTTFEELLASLPDDGVLIDILEYNRTLPAEDHHDTPDYERQFIAFVIRPKAEKADQVRVVPLGPAAPIVAAVDSWRESFGMSPEGMRAGAELRQAIWLPLVPALGDARTVLISTDGALGRLPIGALPGKEPGKFLLEEYRLATIPVPQLLPALIHDKGKREVERELLLLGDVDYEAAPDGAKSPTTKKKRPLRPGEKSGSRGPSADVMFKPLANTAGEIASIGSLYGRFYMIAPDDPRSLAQAEATEANFRALSGQYRHLHLATHGFFAAAEHTSALATTGEQQSRHRGGPIQRNAAIEGFNPGLLSGLALAGANREPTDKADDGILTSQEIAFLPLEGVDTVVLSACDTGLGDVAGGEGLLGVQRAFQVAGARTTVAGYWRVDDLVTRLLMERFYLNLWEKNLPRLDALREAQLYVLNHPEAIRGADAAKDEPIIRTSPRFWAAFGLSGDWR